MYDIFLGGLQQPQPWPDDIILTPQVTQNPKNLSLVMWVKLFRAATEDVNGKHIYVLKHY